ncbi:RING-type E3 ubiquitin transferase [Quillaja saponaria]|uniref:RING-type E3 ubiquitin transferase n=1 Tax=Quillaja saponaria TaxID=32244 RepID=A0AAD7PGN0_QUISA|nr:RING-type E3 ubiquitin transferase [Quillaja saponaria]
MQLNSPTPLTGSYCSWWSDLVLALQAAKRLLDVSGNFCSDCSPDLAANPAMKIVSQFECVTRSLEKALGNLPCDLLDISVEVGEQVELVRSQLRRATKRYGSSIQDCLFMAHPSH